MRVRRVGLATVEGVAVIGWVCSILATIATTAPATTQAALDRPTVLVVVGAEGTPEYGREFTTWADRWHAAADRGGARFVVIGRAEPSVAATDRDRLKQHLQAEMVESPYPLWIVLIGHGTYDGRETKFNLRGPDVTDVELAEWLKPTRRPLAVIDCTASSAPFLNRLSVPNRVVITATRSGSELQFARFGDYLSAAIADPSADLDKDDQTSLLEAFLAASHRVDEFYKQAGRLATEHALLDDNGDGLGTPGDWFSGIRATKAARDGSPLDGPRARQWHLVPSDRERAIPAEVRVNRDELELAIESLRQKKSSMSEDEYYEQLEPLLLELARVYESR